MIETAFEMNTSFLVKMTLLIYVLLVVAKKPKVVLKVEVMTCGYIPFVENWSQQAFSRTNDLFVPASPHGHGQVYEIEHENRPHKIVYTKPLYG